MTTASFAGIELKPDGSIHFGDEWQNTSSVSVTVDVLGAIRDRATLTRVTAGAIVAGPLGAVVGALLRKRVDERETYLVVTGDIDWVVPVKKHQASGARSFAAKVNQAARDWKDREAPRPAPPAPSTPRRGVYRPGPK